MKKHLSLFVPLMALFLTLAPLTARAQYTGSANGHDWVILWEGGPRWATVNVGASTETDCGNYYMYGCNSTSSTYGWAYNTYKTSSYQVPYYTKYGSINDGNIVLESGDDAATAAWGQGWRTPTKIEMDDLKVYCNYTCNSTNKGITFTSKTTGQSIFLRSAGYKGSGGNNSGSSVFRTDWYGKYMTSTSSVTADSNDKERDIYHYMWYTPSATDHSKISSGPSTSLATRGSGYTIRAVYVPSNYYDVDVVKDNSGYGAISGGNTTIENVLESSAITVNDNTLTIGETTVTATPIAADASYIYYFTGWTSGGNAVTSNTTVDGNMTITANFARKSSNCTITIATPAGYGNISVSDGINTYAVGQSHTFNRYTDSGKVLTVTATPASGCVFVSWLGDLTQTGTNPYTATYTISTTTPDNITIGATFAPTYMVTFKDYNGTNLVEPFALQEGLNPVYSGSTPSRKGYIFTGWTDANEVFTAKDAALPALTGNVVYTATYVKEPYFTITNTHASATTTVKMRKNSSYMTSLSFKYRILNANGEVTKNWTNVSVTASSSTGTTFGSIPAGGKMQIYGSGGYTANANYYDYFMITGGSPEISGNILSLVACSDGETVDNNYSLPTYCFRYLFYNCTALTNAEELELPSSTVSTYAYANMFNGCTGLKKAPKELPATTLGTYCYYRMFYNCSTMVSAPERLPALALPEQCYYEMFYKNTALTTAPEIDATSVTGTQTCCNMFYGCSALTKAPSELKIESLRNNTYYYMFYGCTNLEKSPDIYATTYANNGMYCMFQNCSKLKQIRIYFSGTLGAYSSQTQTWVASVRSTGDFYCPPEISRTNDSDYGTSKIPLSSSSKWTIFSYNLTFVPKDCSWSDATNANKQFTWKTDTSDVNSFLRAEAGAKFYTNEACTNEITISEIQALLPTQQELSAETTKYIYARKVSSYALSWDANGGTLSGDYTAAGDYEAGATITAPTAILAGYTYTWDPDFTGTMPAANTTYTAQWTQKSYTLNATASAGGSGVTRSDNGSSETVKRYGDNVVLTPVANTGYHFTDWTGTDANDLVDNEDGTYTLTIADKADNYEYAVTANFAPNTHRLTWTTDGNTLTGDYTHGEAIAYGTTIIAPNTPTKNATAQYTYTFNGWEPALDATMPDNDVTYTATWTETKRQYTLTWDVNGGNALTGTYTNGTIDWGTDIVKPANPTRTDYTFGGWDANNDGKADEVAKTMPTTSLTYKAIWIAELPNITLCENCDNDHYNTFKSDYDGETVNVTYPRQFSASKWSTMCLPFSIELPEMIAQKMYGRVYEFKYATGNANTNSGVNLYFSNAKKIEAGKCYIVNANDALAAKTSFVFSGVTIDLTNDKGAALTSVGAYDNLPGYLSEGKIELVGTLRNGTLHGTTTGNRYMGLKDNKIYYPNISQGSTIWAYRGIFRSKETLNIEKMRIIVDGEDMGELIIDEDGEILDASGDAPSRKFFRDGVLYIEREGVIYDAQGKRVEGSF